MHYFNKKALYLLSLSILLMLSIPSAHAGEHESKVSGEVAFSYHNKFVEDGLNEIPGDSIFTPEFVFELEGIHIGNFEIPSFFVGGEWVIAETQDFTESNLFIGKAWEWEDFSLEFSYTWIHEEEDEEEEENGNGHEEEENEDHEFVLSLACECLPWEITPEIAYIYSAEVDGGAFEVELAKEIEMEHFSIEPYVAALIDFGYVSEEYDGLNHIAVGLAVSVPLNDSVSLKMYGTHSFAEENVRREGGDDQTWGGIGLEFEI